jgi:hypothetical protein
MNDAGASNNGPPGAANAGQAARAMGQWEQHHTVQVLLVS